MEVEEEEEVVVVVVVVCVFVCLLSRPPIYLDPARPQSLGMVRSKVHFKGRGKCLESQVARA